MDKYGYLSKREEAKCTREMTMTSKEDLLIELKIFKAGLAKKNLLTNRQNPIFYDRLISLVDKLIGLIDQKRFMNKLEDFWGYVVEITEMGISVFLAYFVMEYDDFGSSEEEPQVVHAPVDVERFTLLEVKPKMLSIEEYAKLYEVEPGTIRQWIRRGKIRSAKKNGRDWYISELSDPSGKGYENGGFKWDMDTAFPEPYAYLSDYTRAEFFGFDKVHGKYKVWLTNDSKSDPKAEELFLDVKDREALEMTLIGHPQVTSKKASIYRLTQKH